MQGSVSVDSAQDHTFGIICKGGGYLGRFEPPYTDHVLAVEFDTFKDKWDPRQVPHIGIDFNSIISTKTLPFQLDNSRLANVVIKYDASTKILNVVLVFPSTGTIYTLSEIVDLKQEFPVSEWVVVGLSATTGLPRSLVGMATVANLIQCRQHSEFQCKILLGKPGLIPSLLTLALNDALTYDKRQENRIVQMALYGSGSQILSFKEMVLWWRQGVFTVLSSVTSDVVLFMKAFNNHIS
ncbi:hypothetical protein VNO78_21687 [Psophocarpus tetragonolobus]|uniref:Legume lectin domain-containing protein n=1 Tax=Psophocarpus tetragonolobus TaxID=3891 RepID=A0AAN9SCG2_PSOTE